MKNPQIKNCKILTVQLKGEISTNHASFKGFLDYQARALRALGLLLADGAPTVGGGRLFDGSAKFFYGNSCNSGMESRKMVPNVGN